MATQEGKVKENENIQPLEAVLQYKNENVPHRFKKHFKVSDEEADNIFNETLKWLWFCAVTYELNRLGRIDFKVGVIQGLPVIDQMWHNFILHTEDYLAFCDEYLGGFVHHVPTKKSEDTFRTDFSEEHLENMKKFYNNQHSLTFDIMGEATCLKWYEEYAGRYSKEQLDEIRKPISRRPVVEENV